MKRSGFFAWKEAEGGPEIVLPQYDVSQVSKEILNSIDATGRLRIPNHLPLIQGICEGKAMLKRILVIEDGGKTVAVALDEDIRKELRMRGAVPLGIPFRCKLTS